VAVWIARADRHGPPYRLTFKLLHKPDGNNDSDTDGSGFTRVRNRRFLDSSALTFHIDIRRMPIYSVKERASHIYFKY
jgi:hypothetical protein